MIKKTDIVFEFTKGKGPGGQHRNKTSSAVRATHAPTGITVFIDGRDQHKNKRKAIRVLDQRVCDAMEAEIAKKKKLHRDHKIHNTKTVRTYDFSRGVVTDHRSKRVASLKNVLEKGRLDLLQEVR